MQARRPRPTHQIFDYPQPGWGRGRRRGVEQFHQAVDLGFGLVGRLADRLERLGGGSGVPAGELLTGVGLDDHQADGVSDDVVQFAGDTGALVADRLLGEQLAFFLDLAGAVLELFGHVPPRRYDQAAEPWPGYDHR